MSPRIIQLSIVMAVFLFGATSSEGNTSANVDISFDVKCLIVSMQMSESDDSRIRGAGTVSTAYYLGRIDGAQSPTDLGKLIKVESAKMTPKESSVNKTACGNLLSSRGKALKTASESSRK